MQYIILLVGSITFLFTLYVFCHDDFVLFRKNIDMEQIFNLAFLALFAGLFFARLGFVILYFKPLYLNPLAFFLFPYFPGLSIPAGLIGSGVVLLMLLGGKKYPEGRIFDFFVIAFFTAALACVVLLFGSHVFVAKKISLFYTAQALILFFFSIITAKLSKNHTIKEGSTGLISLTLFSLLSIALILLDRPTDLLIAVKESILWVVIFLIEGFLFFKQDSLLKFVKGVFGK